MLVEIIIVLGLIASMTPILYKQVSERRQDIDNINEANRLLLLKNATREYIKENKEALATGTVVLEPIDIGVDISGYQIEIRKDSDGTINAMIAASGGGNDLRAGKIASLLGVSAGIYSAQNTEKAWGINGVWAEDISNYGFTSLPTGIPVITTTYDKEDASGLNEEQLKDFIENTAFDKVTAQQFCIDNPDLPENERCITSWSIASFNPIEVISQCNADYTAGVNPSTACAKGWEKNLNRSCSDISIKYKGAGFLAHSGIYALTSSADSQVERACYFVKGELPTGEELVNAVKTNDIARRYYFENNNSILNCNKILSLWPDAPSDFYTFVTGTATYTNNNICVFANREIASDAEAITQCNSAAGTSAACRYGWNNGLNRTCDDIVQYHTTSGWYNITTASNASSQPCYFVRDENSGNYRSATAVETIVQCNTATTSSAMNCNIARRYGYVKGYNTSCSAIIGNYSAGSGNTNSITSFAGGNQECCNCTIPCADIDFSQVSGYECRNVNGWGWVRSTSYMNYWDSQTFCSALGMTLKSVAQIQAAGLGKTGSNPFSVAYWLWTSDAYNCGESYPNDCGWLEDLNTANSGPGWISRNYSWNASWRVYYYALCGPK